MGWAGRADRAIYPSDESLDVAAERVDIRSSDQAAVSHWLEDTYQPLRRRDQGLSDLAAHFDLANLNSNP